MHNPLASKPHSLNYSLLMLLTLYLAQGLPMGFMTQALPTLLRYYGVSLTQIGVSGLLMLPWAIKFLWSPYVDAYGYRNWGHYRSWILVTQTLTIVCLLVLAYLPIDELQHFAGLWGLFITLFLLNTLCATQDIATDGLAVNILKKGQVHWGNTFQVIGSRLGFILGGGAVLYAIDMLSWKVTFLALALGVLLNSLLILFYQEPVFKRKNNQPSIHFGFKQKLKDLYGYLWSSRELKVWLMVVLSYKVADGLAGPVLKPMMVDMGLSLSQIGINVTVFGACCALLGALFAGWLIRHYALSQMLIVFAILQILSLLYYIALAFCFEQSIHFAVWHIYFANAIEEFCAAMSLVAMLSVMMCYARQQYAATDFTIQVSIMGIVSGGLYLISGKLADVIGYFNILLLIFVVAVICLVPKLYWQSIQKIS